MEQYLLEFHLHDDNFSYTLINKPPIANLLVRSFFLFAECINKSIFTGNYGLLVLECLTFSDDWQFFLTALN